MKNLLTKLSIASFGVVLASCSPVQKSPVPQNETSKPMQSVSSGSKLTQEQIRNKLIEELVNSRLKVDVIREVGGRHGCELQEPYYRLNVALRSFEQAYDPEKDERYGKEQLEESDIAQGIALIESTGEVHNMPVCLE